MKTMYTAAEQQKRDPHWHQAVMKMVLKAKKGSHLLKKKTYLWPVSCTLNGLGSVCFIFSQGLWSQRGLGSCWRRCTAAGSTELQQFCLLAAAVAQISHTLEECCTDNNFTPNWLQICPLQHMLILCVCCSCSCSRCCNFWWVEKPKLYP